AESVDTARAAGDKRRRDPIGAKNIHGAIHGIALGDSPQVDFNPTLVESDRPPFGVQFQMLIPNPLEHLNDFSPRGQAATPAEETPGLHQRADGDVEGAVRLFAAADGDFEQMKQSRLNDDRMTRSLAVDG